LIYPNKIPLLLENSYLRTRKNVFEMKNIAENGRFPSLVNILQMPVIYLFVQFLIAKIFSGLDIKAPETSDVMEGDAANITTYLSEQEALGAFNAWVYPLVMVAAIMGIVLLIRCYTGKWSVGIKHSWAGFNPNVLLVGVLWLLSAQIVLEPLVLMLPKSESSGLGLGLWAIVTAVISAPILEEVLCRGLILESLRKRYSVGVSILISALFFGLIHYPDIATMIVATVSGLILGVLYVRTSSIFASMIVHSINNAMAFTLINFEKDQVPFSQMVGEGTNYYIFYGIALVIFVAASIEAYFKVFRAKKEQEQIPEEAVELEQDEVKDEELVEVQEEKVEETEDNID
jgi:membrane protease YdiL (CAAX protease family)